MTTTGPPPVGSRWRDADGDTFTVAGEPDDEGWIEANYDDPEIGLVWLVPAYSDADFHTRLDDVPATDDEFHYPQPGDTWVSATSDVPVTVLGVHTTLELAFGDETPDDPPVRMGIDEFLADYEFGEGAA